MGGNNNPMMSLGDMQMPINQINPQDLMGNPQALYAYHQMMAAIHGANSNPQGLNPEILSRQNNMMQQFFPQMRRF